jgi:pilus assembly protein Flp/PilA
MKPSGNRRHAYLPLLATDTCRQLGARADQKYTDINQRKQTTMIEYMKTWLELKTDRRAVTAIEYGLIAALIAVVIIAGVTALGTQLNAVFNGIEGKLVVPG